jgi:putative membrane protein
VTEPDVRFSLANERTLLAYQRTAIGLVAAAVAVAHFLDDALAFVLAVVLLGSGGIAAVGGYLRYREADRAIREGRPLPGGPTALILSVALVVCLLLAGAYVVTTAT